MFLLERAVALVVPVDIALGRRGDDETCIGEFFASSYSQHSLTCDSASDDMIHREQTGHFTPLQLSHIMLETSAWQRLYREKPCHNTTNITQKDEQALLADTI